MTILFTKLFQPSVLTTTAAAIYTVPASPTTSLLGNGQVLLTNDTASTIAVSLWAVPSGGSNLQANLFFPAIGVAAYQTQLVNVPQLGAGDALWASAGTSSAISIAAMNGVIQS
jgi:hypothetical protein